MRRTILIAGVALLALGACAKKSSTAAATGTAATASATASAPAARQASATAAEPALFQPPPRRSGLWENRIATQGMNQTIKMCIDGTVDQKMKWWGSQAGGSGKGKVDCREEKVTRSPAGGWSFHAVCNMGESGTITSDGQASGDFASHYKVEVTSVTTGSPMAQANGTHTTTIEASWLGPCPADMKPGDMDVSGFKINMLGGPGSSGAGRGPAMHGHITGADMAKLRAQAEAMEKAARQSQ